MGILHVKTANQRISLRMRCLFGRDARCDVRIDDPKVSHEHMSLRWKDGGWELRDLGSVNGTYVGSRRLGSGERVQLEAGAVFSISSAAAVFELLDASPPVAAALHRASGSIHLATGGILVLPNDSQPRMTLFATSDGKWYVEMDEAGRPAKHGEIVELDDDLYVLEVPTSATDTVRSGNAAPMLESIGLRFAVAPDEEHVEVTLVIGAKASVVPTRRYHYLLLTLARAWLEDTIAPASLRGYRFRDDLCDMLQMDAMKLNVEIYRLRKQFAELGVQGAAGIIERRPGAQEIRIGVTDFEIVTL